MGAARSLVCSNMFKSDYKAACWLRRPRPWKQSEAHGRTREELQAAQKLSSTATFSSPQEVLFGPSASVGRGGDEVDIDGIPIDVRWPTWSTRS